MLTDAIISATPASPKPVKLAAGNGLVLEIRPTGRKFWRYRYRLNQKEQMYTAGEYCPAVPNEPVAAATARQAAGCLTIQEAQSKVEQWRTTVRKGHSLTHNAPPPASTTPNRQGESFYEVSQAWINQHIMHWSLGYARDVQSVLAVDVFPIMGNKGIQGISPADILAVLQRIESRDALTVANNARQWISAIFDYAIATLRVQANPATVLKRAIPQRKTKHHPDMTRQQVGVLLQALDQYAGHRQTAIAVHLLLLTFVRSGELRNARWEEFDLARAEWRIPAERMKAKRPHVVPLSEWALDLLLELQSINTHNAPPSGYLFAGAQSNASMGYNTINKALDSMGLGVSGAGFSAHCFRSTASTMLNDAGFMPDAIERQLAHIAADKTRASYNHTDLMDYRRVMMQSWADMVRACAHRCAPVAAAVPPSVAFAEQNPDSSAPNTYTSQWLRAC